MNKESFLSFVAEVAMIVGIALVIVVPLRYFVFQTFYVKGASMEPNFHNYEYLIIDKVSYARHDPHRGDIVVIHNPQNASESFIKRVIGLPGETISFQGGKVYVNGTELDESAYLAKDVQTMMRGDGVIEVPENSYVVLGDNRAESLDSRYFGPVDRTEIIGRTWLRTWPLKRFTHFTNQNYNI